MDSLIVIGGRLRPIAGGLHRTRGQVFDKAVVAEVSLATGSVKRRMSWEDEQWPDVSQVFKGGRWYGEQLLLCTERNLVWVDPTTWETVSTWSHPAMNDVHDVGWFDGQLWIASSGLDAVLQVMPDGEVRVHGLEGKVTLPRTDLRAEDLAPNRSHPTGLFWWEGRVWVTRFEHSDAVPVTGPKGHLGLGARPVHDGLPTEAGVYFTSVDGRLLLTGRAGLHAIVLDGPDHREEPLGWCRGVHVHGDHAWVGFTRIRTTRFPHHLAWTEGRLKGSRFENRRPTRLQKHDRATGALLDTVELEQAGIDAVFAILPGSQG